MGFLTRMFDTTGFPPRWRCGTAWAEDPALGWLHIGCDLAIWLAYLLLPCVLMYFVVRRSEMVFPRIFWLFGVFIFACGTVHLLEAVIFWVPLYRLSGVLKLITAVASVATAIVMIRVAPIAVTFPGLAEANKRLSDQIAERERVEQNLRQSNAEFEEFTRSIINREERMIELKLEVNELLSDLGREPRYAPEP